MQFSAAQTRGRGIRKGRREGGEQSVILEELPGQTQGLGESQLAGPVPSVRACPGPWLAAVWGLCQGRDGFCWQQAPHWRLGGHGHPRPGNHPSAAPASPAPASLKGQNSPSLPDRAAEGEVGGKAENQTPAPSGRLVTGCRCARCFWSWPGSRNHGP